MNFKRMAIALAIGLFISGTCTWLLSRRMKASASVEAPQLKYLAPIRPMQAGETLKAEDVQLVNWPSSTPIQDAFVKPEAVVGRTLIFPLDKGQPLTEKFLAAPGSGIGLTGRIPDGMRAIALRSDEVVGVAGFLFPGSHVDVLATIHTDKQPEPTTFTVLQNAEVLAAGHQMQPDPEGKPQSVTVVTLLLDPEEAQRAVLAMQQGTIHFVLRSGSDQKQADDPPVELSQLISGTRIVPATGDHPVRREVYRAPEAPVTFSVETISGDKQTTDTFRVGRR